MMKKLFAVGLSLAAILLLFTTQAGATKPQPNKVKETAAPILALAMDGPRVAYASGGRVYSWNVATGATSVVKGRYGTADEIAIAGRRLAWIKVAGFGNTELDHWL
jgi:hypothetical protein